MKSTVKIDVQARFNSNVPVIKIVQPVEIMPSSFDPIKDIDARDTLINSFLHIPQNAERNFLFELSSYYPVPMDNPTHHITNIEAITNDRLFERLRSIVKGTIREWKLDVNPDKVDALFDEIDATLKE